jgi:hypothetical protein
LGYFSVMGKRPDDDTYSGRRTIKRREAALEEVAGRTGHWASATPRCGRLLRLRCGIFWRVDRWTWRRIGCVHRLNDFIEGPKAIRDPGLHRWRDTKRLVNADEVVPNEVYGERMEVRFEAF